MGNKNIKIQEFFDLGLQNFKKNNIKDAENFFKEVLNIEPNHLESIFLLGILCVKNNNIKEAKKLFERVVQIDQFGYSTFVQVVDTSLSGFHSKPSDTDIPAVAAKLPEFS